VLAANPAGAARLGLRPDAASGTLDAAMPGLVRLRALLHEPPEPARREPLVFWTAYGAESLECNVKPLAEPGADSLMLVSLGGEEEPAVKTAPAKLASTSAPPSASVEDAATMQKIARAIRTGFGKAPVDDTAVESTPEASPAKAPAEMPDLSKLAHELRTPLSAIAVAAEIMKEQRFGPIENERYRSYTADIHDNARHALAVINRLLGEAAVSASQRFEAVPLDLNAMAENSVSAVHPLAEEAQITLSHELHSSMPLVLADAMTVKQILFNLLTNAIKFTKAGGEVRVVTGLGFNRSLFIAVQDSGIGMSAEEIARALDAESPPRPERKEAGGLGIGLPLALKLARANGAHLEVDSTPGEGTAVALIFPKERIAQR
jgi:signal transduction histidine kinase